MTFSAFARKDSMDLEKRNGLAHANVLTSIERRYSSYRTHVRVSRKMSIVGDHDNVVLLFFFLSLSFSLSLSSDSRLRHRYRSSSVMLAVTTDTPTPKGRSHLRARTETGDIGGENELEKCDGSTPGDRHCLTLLAVFHPRGRHRRTHARSRVQTYMSADVYERR